MMAINTMKLLLLTKWKILLWILALCRVADGEIRKLDMLLEPDSSYISYIEGFIRTPGEIDLDLLRFTTVGKSYGYFADNGDEDQEQSGDGNESQESNGGSEGNGDRRKLAGPVDADDAEGTQLDIAVFHLPSNCANTRVGCDWPTLGVGKRIKNGTGTDTIRYCCSNDAIESKACEGNHYGRLIINNTIFGAAGVSGKQRVITIPTTEDFDDTMEYGKFDAKGKNGKYVLLLANCNDEGRPVQVKGTGIWKSKHGFLPGDLFGLMYFYAIMTGIYFVLLVWFGVTMKMFEDSTIPIQQWIFATICMGTLELFFRTGDLFVWNEDGTRFWVAFYVGVIVGVLKRGISRCLVVMVSNGWGVIKDDLGDLMKKINFLGGLYIVVSLVRDIITVIALTEVKVMSEHEEKELVNVVTILTLVIAFVDVVFYLWIIDSLNETMEYLEGMSQTSKLLRYLRLRCILLFSILFAVIWSVFGIVDSYDEGIVDQESEWVVDASMELNYVLVLIGVAVLWKPSENAKEYAFVMELPSVTEDGEGGNELELTGVVPSAVDDDEDEISFEKTPKF